MERVSIGVASATIPVTPTDTEEAPPPLWLIFPLGEPTEAAPLNRTYTVTPERLPATGLSVRLVANVELSRLISKPEGAVNMIVPVSPDPETV